MNAKSKQNPSNLAFLALVAGALGISFSPIFVNLSELLPVATAFHRVFLALPVLFLWRMAETKGRPREDAPRTWRDFGWLVFSGFLFAGDLAFWHWSISMTSVANATLFANFTPIFVTIAAFVLFGERFSKLFLAAVLASMVGVAMVVGSSFQLDLRHVEGDVYGLVTAVFYSGYLLAVSRLRSRFSSAAIMLWSSAMSAVFLLPAALFLEGGALLAPTFLGWLILILLAWLSHAGGQGLIAYALAHLPAAFSAVGLLVQPVAAAFLAWLIFDETIAPLQGAGAVVVLLGIFLAHRDRVRQMRRKDEI